MKIATEQMQFLHKESVSKKGLKLLWNRFEALFPENVAGMLYSSEVLTVLRRLIKTKYGEKCAEEEILKTLQYIVSEKIDPETVRVYRAARVTRKKLAAKLNESNTKIEILSDLIPETPSEEKVN